MYWKLKSRIQNIISLFPSTASYEAYYLAQRYFGGLRKVSPTRGFLAAIETLKKIKNQEYSPGEKVFLEVGTGSIPMVPIGYWLMGAESTITIDLNPYLKEELISECLNYMINNKEKISALFGSFIDKKRLTALINFGTKTNLSIKELFDLCQITYIAPGDAANTGLSDQYIDFHTSYAVFEHIQPSVLTNILREGNRIIKKDGLFVNRIDYSDHFSHSDKNISAINFLQYSDDEWEKYANNRYMYMNRLRHDDFLALFESVGQRIIATEPDIDRRSEEIIKTHRLKLNDKFKSKNDSVLAIRGAWIVTKKDG